MAAGAEVGSGEEKGPRTNPAGPWAQGRRQNNLNRTPWKLISSIIYYNFRWQTSLIIPDAAADATSDVVGLSRRLPRRWGLPGQAPWHTRERDIPMMWQTATTLRGQQEEQEVEGAKSNKFLILRQKFHFSSKTLIILPWVGLYRKTCFLLLSFLFSSACTLFYSRRSVVGEETVFFSLRFFRPWTKPRYVFIDLGPHQNKLRFAYSHSSNTTSALVAPFHLPPIWQLWINQRDQGPGRLGGIAGFGLFLGLVEGW